MNDPHVAVLIYSVDTGEEISINNAPPVEEETSELRMRLADDVATFYMKTHYPSEKSARELVDPYLHAWELDVALKYGHKRKLCFSFVRSTIVDRDPNRSRFYFGVPQAGIKGAKKPHFAPSRQTSS
jgi:hypothetical protein